MKTGRLIDLAPRVMRVVAGAILCLAMAGSVSAQLLSDDFNDGNDEGWTHVDLLSLTGVGTTDYSASSGSYVISSQEELPVLAQDCNGGGTFWTPSLSDPLFAEGVVRATVRLDNEISNAFIGLRLDAAGNGYDFAVNNSSDRIFIDRLVGFVGLQDGLSSMPFELVPGQDYIIQGTALGPNLSMKIWKVGDPEPAEPQLTGVDATYTVGAVWLATYYCATPPEGGQISARFDNVTFQVPEPSAFSLALLGFMALVRSARRSSG
jgi:hypothetical protein